VDDGLDEEGVDVPFKHLLKFNEFNEDEKELGGENSSRHIQEGDADAFDLLCTVVKLLMNCKSDGMKPASTDTNKLKQPVERKKLLPEDFPENEGNTVSFTTESQECVSASDCVGEDINVWSIDSLFEMTSEVFGEGNTQLFESGKFSFVELRHDDSLEDKEGDDDDYVKLSVDDLVLNDYDSAKDDSTHPVCCTDSKQFQEAFTLLCSNESSALTGVVFKWSKASISKENDEHLRYRLSVEDTVEGDGINMREVSEKLRSRLLSLCGSIAYLCGDAMGGYKCLKSSILLDNNMLDSRLKISSILLEMDELDKAEAQLMDAKSRPHWENNICLDLHLAELHLHRMEYFPAVRILRATSRRLDFLLEGWDGLVDERDVAKHIGPTIASLHGVAEFRVTPETPLKALNILQRGIETFPDNVSLCVCYGEVLGQAGDPAGALKSYADASAMEPNHPLPYLNASRVYQQLNQMHLCKEHMAKAFGLDRSLSLTLVDIAQFKLHEKRFLDQGEQSAVNTTDSFFEDMSSEDILESALDFSRHVSEAIDVFTARQIARFYAKLGATGLAPIFL